MPEQSSSFSAFLFAVLVALLRALCTAELGGLRFLRTKPTRSHNSGDPVLHNSLISSEVLQDYDPQFMVGCYFPAEYQGEFVTQVSGKDSSIGTTNEPIQYSAINITYNAIPVWGYCRRRVGENVLLMDRMPQCRLRFVWDENSLEHCQTRVHCISRLEVNSVETIRLLRAKEQWRFARSIQASPPPPTSLPSPSTHCILSILRINVDSIPVPTSYEEVFGETRDPSGEREKEVG
uniref:DUF7044 domain-containing protein n=1 Tax=Vespula pensylvanica TaxID=30213 RepID=A0A834UFV0_VESPE|nr:hypothetical protein H0235_004006 [Vespula pensylvanica]